MNVFQYFHQLKLWRLLSMGFAVIWLFWYFYEYRSYRYYSKNNPLFIEPTPQQHNVNNSTIFSWINDTDFINTNIEYITLDNVTQSRRFNRFQKEVQKRMVLNESFIINNWRNLQFDNNLNCIIPNYTRLTDLYDTKYINLHKLSRNICEWEHKTNRKINSKVFDTNKFDYVRKSVRLQQYMNELFLNYGIISVLRCGELMGAFRDGGHFPWESSSDHFSIFPDGLTAECFDALNEKIINELNGLATVNKQKNENAFDSTLFMNNDVVETEWKYYRGGPWENYLRSFGYWVEYEKLYTDGTLLDFTVIKNTKFNQVFYDMFNVKPIDYFNDKNICLCNYSGTIAFAFEETQIDKYLSITYGTDYMNPHPGYKGSIEKIKGYEISSFVYWEHDDQIARECQLNSSKCFDENWIKPWDEQYLER